MATDNHLPDWNDNALSLGRPAAMNTPTLIEWIQRQLETLDETQKRYQEMATLHSEWHAAHPGVYSCCITTMSGVDRLQGIIQLPSLTVNEARELSEVWHQQDSKRGVMYIPEGAKYSELRQPVDPEPEVTFYSRRTDGQ